MESIKELRKICQEKGFEEHVTIKFFRVFSIYITRAFIAFNIGANTTTLIGVIFAIIGGYFYLNGGFLLGSFLFLAFMVFDVVDGEIARYRKSSSSFGEWIDTTAGHLVYPYFFFTLGLGVFFQTNILLYALLGVLAGTAKLIERSVPRSSLSKSTILQSDKQGVSSIKMWASYIGKFPVLFLVVLVSSIFGWEEWFLWFFAIYLMLFAAGKTFMTGFRIYTNDQTHR